MVDSTDDSTGPGRYRFGDIVVDPAAHTLLRAGQPRAVEPKSFAVLLALLQRPGELVGRDELLDLVWGHRHVTPGVLTRAIAQLRAALGDDPQQPRYIQTRHALGYCFVGELSPAPQDGPTQQPAADASAPDVPGPPFVQPGTVAPEPADVAMPDAGHDRSARHWRPRHWLAASALALGVAGLAFWNERAPPSPTEPSVAIMPFVNLGRDRDDDFFVQGLAVEMHDALAGVDGLKVAGWMMPGAVAEAGVDPASLGRRLGVATVLDASVRRDGERLRINARLTECATGYTLWSRSFDSEATDVFAIQIAIASEVARALRQALPAGEARLAKRLASTRNLAAFDAYLRGIGALRSARSDADAEHAIGRFREALSADAGFVRAQAAICTAETRRFEYWHDAAAYARANAACARAIEMEPDVVEAQLALGHLHRVSGDLDGAARRYQAASADPAVAPEALVGLARVHAARGDDDKAEATLARALALRPGDAQLQAEAGFAALRAGRLPEAIAAYTRVVELAPHAAGYWNTLGAMHMMAGDEAAAERALERSVALQPNADALANLGTLRFYEGSYADAVRLYRTAVELDPDDYLNWGNLGDALLAAREPAEAWRAAYARAAEGATEYLAVATGDGAVLAGLAWYRAMLDDPQAALAALQGAEAASGDQVEIAQWSAQAWAALGRAGEAAQRLDAMRAAGAVPSRIRAVEVLQRAAAEARAAQSGPTAGPRPEV
jgi:TolB-like protein/DNA-binding winged helix-turn-helix (wHTH) protein/Flp pilus assembly protein TadD